jgi:lipopolysaccharide transport system permease protein
MRSVCALTRNDVTSAAIPNNVNPTTQPRVTVINAEDQQAALDVRELWSYRELLGFLVWRDIQVRYKQTVIGAGWAVVQPVCTMIIFSLIFGKLAGIDGNGVAYPVFVYAGLLPWLLFSSALTSAGHSLAAQSSLLTKVYFPRLFLPATGIGVALVDFTFSFLVFGVLMLIFGQALNWSILALPLAIALLLALAYGLGLMLSSLTVVYRDFRIAIPFLTQIGLYVTPVVYPLNLVHEKLGMWSWLTWLNPLTGLVSTFRALVLNQPLPLLPLIFSIFITASVCWLGLRYFRLVERRFADIA